MRFLSAPVTALLLWVIAHPRAALLATAALILAFVPGLSRLSIDSTSESLLVPGDAAVAHYQEVEEIFGEDVIETIVIHGADVFTPAVLRAVERLTLATQELDGVTQVVSLTTVNNLAGHNGTLDTSPLLPNIPDDPGSLARIRHDALRNPILVGEVLNASGNTTAIHLSVESRPRDHGFAKRLVDEIETLLQQERTTLGPAYTLYQVGSPFLKTEIIRSIHSDIFTLAPLAALALIACLFLFFGSSIAYLIPILTGLLSIVGTLGFMGWMGYDINPLTTILPSLLIVIGSTEDIHMISEYADEIAHTGNKPDALRNMARRLGGAISMTTITTFFGFLSLSFHSIPILKEFGISASFGIAYNFLITLLIVPPCLHFWPIPKAFRQSHAEQRVLHRLRALILHVTFRHVRWVILIITLLTGIAAWACRNVVVNTSYGEFFRKDSPLRLRYDDLATHLFDGTIVLVTIDGPHAGSLLEPHYLRQAGLLRDYLDNEAGKVIGYTDFFRKLNLEMNDGNPAFDSLPQEADLIAQYALMLSPDDLSRFIDFDRGRARFILFTQHTGSHKINALGDRILAFAREHIDPTLTVRVTGEVAIVGRASDTMSREVLGNLLSIGVTIFIVIAVFFRSPLTAALVMIPNIVPIVINFGLMALSGIPLSTATFPVSVIALGMTVDDTIHMMARYTYDRSHNVPHLPALRSTLSHEIRPVLTTALANAVGFSVLYFGEFASVQQFGFLATWAMITGILTDLFLTPALLSLAPHLKNK